jgi:hypothetical protein
MADERIRRQVAFLAAQMMYHRTETEYFTAKRKAARQLGVEYRHRPGDLPSNKEIRDQIQAMARIHEGPKRLETLRDMRLDGLRLMRILARFRPRLIGSVRTGHVRKGSDMSSRARSRARPSSALPLPSLRRCCTRSIRTSISTRKSTVSNKK